MTKEELEKEVKSLRKDMKKEKNDPTTAFVMFGWGGVLITLIVILIMEYLNLL